MARVTLGTGDTITVGGVTEIFGTTGAQSVTILDGSTVTFRSGFSNGGDTIRLNGKASDFVARVSGSNITLFSAVDGITITIGISSGLNTLVFDNGDTRSIGIVGGVPTIGTQAIGATNTALVAGPGVYTVTGANTAAEGDTVTFTVTRTDTTSAETLLFDVNGKVLVGAPNAAEDGDFLPANGTVTFAAGAATAAFTITLQEDQLLEGLEGLEVSIVKDNRVVAAATAVIVDGNAQGQTFELTDSVDRVGTGSALDLVGSEGTTSTAGQDTIIGTNGINILGNNPTAGDFNAFDVIDGGADIDTLIVLDSASPFTNEPNFGNVTVRNIENLQYTSLRGLFSDVINTTAWTGLTNAEFNIVGFFDQNITLGTGTSAQITQAGPGGLNVFGGGGTLTIDTTLTGNVNVGTNGAANAWTSVSIEGGNDIDIEDNGAQELATVVLDGIRGDAELSGSAIANVALRNLVDGDRDLDITASNVTVTLSNIDVDVLDITSSSVLTVIGDDSVDGLGDITAGGNVTVRSTGGTLVFDDVTSNGTSRTVTLDAAGGSLSFEDILGADVRNVVITGSGAVALDSVAQSGNAAGTVITSTNAGGVFIDDALGNNTQFNGSGNTGNDDVTFNQTTRANTFGGGNDNVRLDTASLGTGGSLDGGAGTDRLFMESNDAAAFTSGAATATSNFEELELTGQDLGKADVINLDDIGFTSLTNVTSNVGAGSVPEITTLNFTGSAAATGADVVTVTGAGGTIGEVTLVDGDTAGTIATKVFNAINANTGATGYSATLSGAVVTVTGPTGIGTNVGVTFTDSTSIGRPSLEQDVVTPVVTVQGQDAIPERRAQFTLNLTGAFLGSGDDIEIEDRDNTGFEIYLEAPVDLSWQNGELASFIVNAVNNGTFAADTDNDFNWTAEIAPNGIDVIFTRDTAGVSAGLQIDTTGNSNDPGGIEGFVFGVPIPASLEDFVGIDDATAFTLSRAGVNGFAGVREEFTVTVDGTASGNDTFTFDGETVTFDGGEGPNDLAAEILAEFDATANWDAVSVSGATITFRANTVGVRTDVTPASFTFGDDTNIGTPSVVVTQVQNGELASVTLNSFVSNSTLTLNAPLGTHTVNLRGPDGSADILNLRLDQSGNHGSVTANLFETVNINSLDDFNPGNPGEASNDALVLNNTALRTLVLTGSDGLDLETNSTSISTINASALGGFFEWEADNNSVNINVTVGNGGSRVDFSLMQIQGGVSSTGNAPVTFTSGSGNDTVITGNQGSSRGTITTGDGSDKIVVGIVDGGNDFWTITDFDDNGGVNNPEDVLLFENTATFVEQVQVLEPNAIFQDYLDAAARGNTADNNFVNGGVSYFYFEGNTYVVQDNSDSEDFVDGSDTVIRLNGIKVLDGTNIGTAAPSDVPADIPTMMGAMALTDFTVV